MRRNVIFFSSAIQHPRHQRRINTLAKYHNVFVLYSIRHQYRDNVASFSHPEEQTLCLGVVENYKYYKRIGLFFRMLSILLKRTEDTIYCTTIESAIAGMLARKQVILEMGDLHQFSRFGAVYQLVDAVLIPRLRALVLTSPYFISDYFAQKYPAQLDRMVVIENKLPNAMQQEINHYRQAVAPPLNPARVRLGLIGSIRYPRMLAALAELLRLRTDLELHIFGDGKVEVFEGIDNCTYHGPFKNPADLKMIYSGIDINVILYDALAPNVRSALPNKLYESIAFCKPILCSEDCALADIVSKKNYGLPSNLAGLEASIDQLIASYPAYVNSLGNAAEQEYLDSEDDPLDTLEKR